MNDKGRMEKEGRNEKWLMKGRMDLWMKNERMIDE